MLTQHIRESLQVTPVPFPDFWVGPGDEARVSAGVSGRRGLSGRSTNVFAQMLKAELDLIRGRYIYNVYLQMFRDASHSSLACSWLCGRLGLVNSRTNFCLQNFLGFLQAFLYKHEAITVSINCSTLSTFHLTTRAGTRAGTSLKY